MVPVLALASLMAVWSPSDIWSLRTIAPSELLMMMQLELAPAEAPLPFEPCPLEPLVPPHTIVPAPLPLPAGSSTFLMATATAARF